MRYEWDERKNLVNQEKHRISFEIAALAFEDPNCLVSLDRIDEVTAEPRWHAIGAVRFGPVSAVLAVVHAYRKDRHGEEIIRIISARKAQKHELRRYQEQTLD